MKLVTLITRLCEPCDLDGSLPENEWNRTDTPKAQALIVSHKLKNCDGGGRNICLQGCFVKSFSNLNYCLTSAKRSTVARSTCAVTPAKHQQAIIYIDIHFSIYIYIYIYIYICVYWSRHECFVYYMSRLSFIAVRDWLDWCWLSYTRCNSPNRIL